MFRLILLKSISRRKGKFALALIAVVLGASVASALLTTSMDVEGRVSEEFRNFGANLLLVPKSDTIQIGIGGIAYGSVTDQEYINETDLPKIKMINWSANIVGYAPYLYSLVEIGNQSVVMTGTWFDMVQRVSPWWSVDGMWIQDRNDMESAMIGTDVSKILGIGIGDTFQLNYTDRESTVTEDFTVVGIITSGGSEDSQIFVNLDMAQEISKRPDAVNTVQVSALCSACPIEDISREIEEMIPYVEGKTVLQVAENEMELLGKIEGMMLMVTFVALAASGFGVMMTMTTSVIERTKEIGLMKAIGARSRRIAGLFYAEAAIIGIIGGLSGYGVGLVLAQFIGQSVFGAPVSIQPIVLPITLGIAVGITLTGSALPVRRSLRIDPARVLRGE